MQLAIEKYKAEICESITKFTRLIISSQPGTGKTTQIPLYCSEVLKEKIIVLVPRRIIAHRMSEFLSKIAPDIAHHTGRENSVKPNSRIIFMTYGVFLLEIIQKGDLENISAVIFDEFHERSLDGDQALSFALDIAESLAPDLRIILMSATLDLDRAKSLLGESQTKLLRIEGSQFQVATQYCPPKVEEGFFRNIHSWFDFLARIISSEAAHIDADILVFLPGIAEIRQVAKRLELKTIILHSSSDPNSFQEVFEEADTTRIILSSSIAESSLTLPFIKLVIDSGLERHQVFHITKKRNSLETNYISQASAEQRKGRAGRVQNGRCLRLWQEDKSLPSFSTPEIESADLLSFAYKTFLWSHDGLPSLKLFSQPKTSLWQIAVKELTELNLLGVRVSENLLSLDPRLIAIHEELVKGAKKSLESFQLLVGLVYSEKMPILQGDWDEPSILKAIDKTGEKMMARLGTGFKNSGNFLDFPLFCLKHFGFARKTKNNQEYAYPDGEILKKIPSNAEFIIPLDDKAASFIIVSENLVSDLINSSPWIRELIFNGNKFSARKFKKFGALEFQNHAINLDPVLDRKESHSAFNDFIENNGVEALSAFSSKIEKLKNRIIYAGVKIENNKLSSAVLPFLKLDSSPSLSEQDIYHALLGFVENKMAFEKNFPEIFSLPNGKKIALNYPANPEEQITLSIRLQDAFGFTSHPYIGAKPLIIELLSPAQRPIQKTSDILGFWTGSYAEVRKEMRGRYPKHKWPEDPRHI